MQKARKRRAEPLSRDFQAHPGQLVHVTLTQDSGPFCGSLRGRRQSRISRSFEPPRSPYRTSRTWRSASAHPRSRWRRSTPSRRPHSGGDPGPGTQPFGSARTLRTCWSQHPPTSVLSNIFSCLSDAGYHYRMTWRNILRTRQLRVPSVTLWRSDLRLRGSLQTFQRIATLLGINQLTSCSQAVALEPRKATADVAAGGCSTDRRRRYGPHLAWAR